MRNGCVYERRTLALPTSATGGSALLPTPAAGVFNDGESLESWTARNERLRALGINGNGMGTPLTIAVKMLRTPTAQLAVNGGSQHPDKRKAGGHGPTLADEVEHLLPTPTARLGDDTSRGADPARYKGPQSLNGRRSNLDDCIAAIETKAPWLLPTPTAMDSHGARNATANRRSVGPATNNDGWTLCDVFWTGETTRPPSIGGKPSSAAQLPGQLSLDGLESA